ncbi:MAG: IclR family transcriptional regulator domain-containing protein, partial [Advenella sp.]
DSLDAYLAQAPFERFTKFTIVEAASLKNAINQAGEQGYALANQQLELGICGLAVPIMDDRNKIVAALTTSLNLARHEHESILEKFLPIMQQTAQSISRGLGYRGN